MQSKNNTQRAKAVRAYLSAIGAPITSVQAHEVVARCLGLKNKHVSCATAASSPAARHEQDSLNAEASERVLTANGAPLTLAEMQALNWEFDLLVALPLEVMGDIEMQNSFASKRITGNDYALEGIGYAHAPEISAGPGFVTMRVTGYVSSPQDFFEVEDETDAIFYKNLEELLSCLAVAAKFELGASPPASSMRALVIEAVHADAWSLLWRYAQKHGSTNDEVNAKLSAPVFSFTDSGISQSVRVGDLKYATKLAAGSWHIHLNDSSVISFKT